MKVLEFSPLNTLNLRKKLVTSFFIVYDIDPFGELSKFLFGFVFSYPLPVQCIYAMWCGEGSGGYLTRLTKVIYHVWVAGD